MVTGYMSEGVCDIDRYVYRIVQSSDTDTAMVAFRI